MSELQFLPLSKAGFEELLSTAVKEYTNNLLKYKEQPNIKAAKQAARQEIMSYIPMGLQTPGHFIYKIVEHGRAVGYIWYLLHQDPGEKELQVFLNYIHIFPKKRRKGLGSQALKLFEEEIKKMGIHTIVFYIFKKNMTAYHFYLKNGYHVVDSMPVSEAKQDIRCGLRKDLS